jgi:hypothetical protein
MHGHQISKTRFKLAAVATGVSVIALCALGFAGGGAEAADADTPVKLGTTEQFAVLAGAGITNTNTTTIEGDIGSFPTTDMTITGVTLDGTNQGGNDVTEGAKDDLVTAYNEAALALPPTSVETELGGKTLVGGIYKGSTELGLTGKLTLDGGQTDGTASSSVFIFQAGTTLITEANSSVVLTGGAQACNIFWQVGSSAVFRTGTHFEGTVMAYTEAIVAEHGATFVGRLLARTAAVTLDNNTITKPICTPVADDAVAGDTVADDAVAGDAVAGDTDTGSTDTGDTDTGSTDTGDTDTGSTDTGSTDTGDTDTGGTDTGSTDTDLGSADSGSGGTDSGSAEDQDTSAVEAASADAPLPDTGGTPWILLPIGAVAVLAGWTVLTSRPRARRH